MKKVVIDRITLTCIALCILITSPNLFAQGKASLASNTSSSAIGKNQRLLEIQNDNVELIKSFVADVVNGGNIEAIPKYWHEDMIWRGGSLGEYHGIDAFIKLVRATAGKAFSEMHLEIEEIHPIGENLVVDRFTNSGKNTGSFFGYEATDKFAKWDGMAFYKITDGKIKEAWFAEDILSIYFQLGLLKQ